MAKNRNTDFFSFLRSQGLRKRVAKALADLEAGGQDARGNAEKVGRRVIADLRGAADTIEKRLNVGGAGTRSRAAKKAAKTRKRTTTKRRPAAKKSGARKTTARKTTARKSTAGKSTARKTTARKSTARKSTARKSGTRKSSARKRS
jgi:DNA-binding protein HU-beta